MNGRLSKFSQGTGYLMERSDEKKRVVITRGSASEPYAKIIIVEKRKATKDRRQSNTFIANDRRSGIADRRELR